MIVRERSASTDVRLTICRMTPDAHGGWWTWRATDAAGNVTEGPNWRRTPGAVMRFLVDTFPAASIDIDDPWA